MVNESENGVFQYTDSDSSDSNDINYNNSVNSLSLCALHNPILHGGDYSNVEDAKMCGRYLHLVDINISCPYFRNLQQMRKLAILRQIYNVGGISNITHPTIRAYIKIIFNNKFIVEPQIVEKISGPGDFCSVIIKTHYLRLIQRKWKRIFAERKRVIALRKQTRNILYRSMHGKWPKNCSKYV